MLAEDLVGKIVVSNWEKEKWRILSYDKTTDSYMLMIAGCDSGRVRNVKHNLLFEHYLVEKNND